LYLKTIEIKALKQTFFCRLVLIIILANFIVPAKAQSYLGVGFGTFFIPGASQNFRGYCPTVKYEYIKDNQRSTVYFDLSYFKKQLENEDPKSTLSYLYSQIGFKQLIAGDADEKKLLPYLGGGLSAAAVNSKFVYRAPSPSNGNSTENMFVFGFHFNAGMQYNLKPVILELRGNFDLNLKPLVPASSYSHILTNLRLSALLPLKK
jgi:hypothetical protein